MLSIIKMFKLVTLVSLVALVSGHGRLSDPINRSSLWRVDRSVLANYNDNGLFCGGSGVQHGVNKGKCGVCGDDYRLPHPQPNENTGKYGTGKIVARYKSGQVIDVESTITANHRGNIQYHLCKINNSNMPESGEKCFKALQFADGSEKFYIHPSHRVVRSRLKLPKGLQCNHCVLRWTYTAGNNWGMCGDGTGKLGCGPQETFRSCADVEIL